jgi:OPT family oligopeptide transporter
VTNEPEQIPAPPPDDAPAIEHDRYWLKYIYQGDRQKQLTVRALLTGCLIGGVMSISNLYVGLKIGWGLGVAITAAVLAFAFFTAVEKLFRVKPENHFSLLENNTMQTAASAAGYMSSAGLVSAIPALTMVSEGKFVLTVPQTIIWLTAISLLGIVAAIPVKRKLINQERLRFPSGIAAAETLRSLHGDGEEGMIKGRSLAVGGVIGAVLALLRDGMKAFPDKFAVFGAVALKRSLFFDPSLVMIGAGVLIGLRVTFWMCLAGVVSRYFAADWLLQAGFIDCGKLAPGVVCTADAIPYGVINKWTLWPGVALMVTHSLVVLLLQAPKMIAGFAKTLSAQGGEGQAELGELAAVEVPFAWFAGGFIVVGAACVALQYFWFGIPISLGMLAVVLSLVLAFVAARSTGETDTNPTGAMGKVTQLTFGAVMPGQIQANLLAANVTAGAASHAGDLLTDMKAGYLVGARPRYQVVAQVFGVLVGAVFASIAYSVLVRPEDLGGEQWPAPAAVVWKSVAELLSKGISNMEWHKLAAIQWAAGIGVALAILEAVLPLRARRLLPSVNGVGIAMTVSAASTASMFFGAVLAWIFGKVNPKLSERFTVVVSSGFIAGETLMAVGIIAYGVLTGSMGK